MFHQRARCRLIASGGGAARDDDDASSEGLPTFQLPLPVVWPKSIVYTLQTLPAHVPSSFVRSAAAFRGKCACALGKAKRPPASIWVDRYIPAKFWIHQAAFWWCCSCHVLGFTVRYPHLFTRTHSAERLLISIDRSMDRSVRACMLCDEHYYQLTVPYAHT